ncbi:MAG: RdgB/HAM1 family non-canonical purine NTP pyrophosphatase [Gammaproteobacteria bacterium]|nr:RdgB/HAM1 family non-canonical purine NTP pyrophosphatase [Gammaproteobacteria bacterium]
MTGRAVVVATGNAGKLRELQALLGNDWELVAQGELGIEPVAETGTTFRENALLKARHAAAISGLPAIADDSGLEVDALHGEPGVYSARYAGAEADDAANNAKLLAEMAGIPAIKRTARFRCCMVFVESADAEPLVAAASWDGQIATEPRGAGGFGYDPLFIDPESGRHSAELSAADKNARSHRGQAARKLRDLLLRQA